MEDRGKPQNGYKKKPTETYLHFAVVFSVHEHGLTDSRTHGRVNESHYRICSMLIKFTLLNQLKRLIAIYIE
jgi:hypothetical protein